MNLAADLAAGPAPRVAWRRLAEELTLRGIRVDSDHDGRDVRAEARLHYDVGRALSSLPFLSTVAVVGAALDYLGDHDRLRRIADGTLVATAVLGPATGRRITAQVDGVTARLSGNAPSVLDANVADALLVEACCGGDDDLICWLSAGSAGADVRPIDTADPTRHFGSVHFDDALALIIARGKSARRAVRAARVNGRIAVAADCLGLAARAVRPAEEHLVGAGDALTALSEAGDVLLRALPPRTLSDVAVAAAPANAAIELATRRCATIAVELTGQALRAAAGSPIEDQVLRCHRRALSNRRLLDPYGVHGTPLSRVEAERFAKEVLAS